MATTSPRLGVPYIAEGQDDKETAHSEGVNRFETMIQLSVKDRDLSDPDDLGSPTRDAFVNGDLYLVPSGATGNWSGQDDDIAAYYDGWIFLTPNEGWRVWIEDEDRTLLWDGSAWIHYLPVVGLAEQQSGHIESPTTKTYVLVESAAYRYDIDTMIGICASGDVVVTLFIDGTNVAGITAETFDQSQSTKTATGASPEDNTAVAGNRVTMLITAGSPDPIDFSFTIKTTRL